MWHYYFIIECSSNIVRVGIFELEATILEMDEILLKGIKVFPILASNINFSC